MCAQPSRSREVANWRPSRRAKPRDHLAAPFRLDQAAEELVAETVAYSVCASGGVEPGDFSISYLAGWSERRPIATIERTAAPIDRLSRRMEVAVAAITLDG